MNGGFGECDDCGHGLSDCVCKEIAYKKRVAEGKEVIESLWQAMAHLPRWRMKIVKFFWPDIVKVAEALKEYYWEEE